jgi:hypothetical protein
LRPDYALGQSGRLPPDVLVDGIPLSQAAHPEFWTVFGDNWGLFDSQSATRAMANASVLWLYSPDTRTVQLRLTPAAAPEGAMLSIANDDRVVSAPVPLQAGQITTAALPLQRGWNALTLTIELPAAKPSQPKEGRKHRHERAAKSAPAAAPATPDAAPVAPALAAADEAKRLSVRQIEILTDAN